MNILISDKWLREYLDTKATSGEIAKYLSLSGPSIEKVTRVKDDVVYDFEVTTNRVDMMSIYGIAREASAILPRFGIKARLRPLVAEKQVLPKDGLPLELKSDPKLTYRLLGVVLEDIKNWTTPKWMKMKLENAGMR